MTRYNTIPPSMPIPPKPAVAYSDRNKEKDKAPPGEDNTGTKTTRWLLENSLQRRLAIAEHRVDVMNAEAARLRKGLHLSVASAAAGTARAAEAAHAVHAASVKEAEEAAAREREVAAAQRAESVRRQASVEQRRRENLAAKGLDAPAAGSVEKMWMQMEQRDSSGNPKYGKHQKKKRAQSLREEAAAGGQDEPKLSLAAAFLGFDLAADVAARTGSRRGRRREDKDQGVPPYGQAGARAATSESSSTIVCAIDTDGAGAGGVLLGTQAAASIDGGRSGRESAPPELPGTEQEARSVVLPAL